MGINLNLSGTDIPEDLVGKVASVHEVDPGLKVNDLIVQLERNLIKYCQSFRGSDWSTARAEWLRHATRETGCQDVDGIETVRGRPVDMTDDGWLVLDTDLGLVTVKPGDLAGAVE
jgi:biotin-(acetyl-CoA carboxylase) ligase